MITASRSYDPNKIVSVLKRKLNHEKDVLNRDNILKYLAFVDRVEQCTKDKWKSFYSPMRMCIQRRNEKLIDYLNKLDVDWGMCCNEYGTIEKETNKKWPLMNLACQYNFPSLIRLFLNCQNCDPNVTETQSLQTPLMTACNIGCIEPIYLLLNDPRCDLNLVNYQGTSFLHFASKYISESSAVPKNDLIGLCLLLHQLDESGSLNLNVRNRFGNTPLHCVAKYKNGPHWQERILILLSFGADPSITNKNKKISNLLFIP